ncbi:hypothetical protein ABIB83_009082 [Bradyrhizobium sp. I1.8.5]|uniref:DUF2934 domain-containing protein n=1 Tax=unclassified Bradyrhizobium TaxID=2631580 RepID=UPI003397B809
MAKPTEDDIRTRAHALWELAGKPEGRQEEFEEGGVLPSGAATCGGKTTRSSTPGREAERELSADPANNAEEASETFTE